MMKRGIISLCIALVLLVLGSCTRAEQPTGTVTLTFTTGEIVTRSTTPGGGDPIDGGGIYYNGDTPDLVILIEQNGTIVKRFLGTNTADAIASFVPATKQKLLQVKFTGLDPGVYTGNDKERGPGDTEHFRRYRGHLRRLAGTAGPF